MSVREAVARAMRSGRVITPREFPAIQSEIVDSIEITRMRPGDYLIRARDAEALTGARFRNSREQREFYLGVLHQARETVMTQLRRAVESIPQAQRAERFGCRQGPWPIPEDAAEMRPIDCFNESNGRVSLWLTAYAEEPPRVWKNGLLRYLGSLLPAQAFISPPGDSLYEIQLLDGVFFTAENFSESELPADTRINASMLRALLRDLLPTTAE